MNFKINLRLLQNILIPSSRLKLIKSVSKINNSLKVTFLSENSDSSEIKAKIIYKFNKIN